MSGNDARLSERIASIQQLSGVVSAMRGIAAAREQQSRRQLAGVRAYAGIVAEAISQALKLAPPVDAGAASAARPRACIIFTSEQGFVGSYNDRLCDAAAPLLARAAHTLVIGSRGVRLLKSRGVEPAWCAPMIAQAGEARALANRVAQALVAALSAGQFGGADLVHAAVEGMRLNIQSYSLLPLDLRHFHRPGRRNTPMTYLPAAELLHQLADEYLFAQLAAAALESHAAENNARMQAMAAAQDNIERQNRSLHQAYQMQRQDQITDELIELAAGLQTLPGTSVPTPRQHDDTGADR